MRDLGTEVIGLIPAGGQGLRVGLLPCSKEIYPIGYDPRRDGLPKAVCHYLLDKMCEAGITKVYIVLREGKWDIPAYLRDGKMAGVNLAYLIMDAPFGVPFTLSQAFPFVQEATIAFGFPDIFFDSRDTFKRLLDRLSENSCDVVIGLFPGDRPHKTDMVDMDPSGRIRNILIKPGETDLELTWGVAVWRPVFTKFMYHYVKAAEPLAAAKKELFLGEVIQTALSEGLRVEGVRVSYEPFIDIGTPDDLRRAVQKLMIWTEHKPSNMSRQ